MRNTLLAGLLALAPVAAGAQTPAQAEQQQLVDRATLAAQEMLNDTDGKDAQYVLRRARATMIIDRMKIEAAQFKLGADATATFIEFGGGIEGATTAALNADIVGFTRARGLFAGISLGGSLMSTRTAANLAYYGRPLAAREIVINMEASNPGADPLREVLTRYGSRTATIAVAPAPEPSRDGPYPLNEYRPAPVQQQPLSSPRR